MSVIHWMLSATLWGLPVIPWVFLVSITVVIAGFLYFMYPAWDSKKKDSNGHPNKPRHEKWFYAWLIGLSALGGFWALFLPLALNQKFNGPNADGNQLRLHLLYITGGVLALITLGETHRKNTVDREKAKVEKDNYEKSQTHQDNVLEEQQRQFNETIAKERERIEVDKAKNEQDHIRQVHAERRSRYTTAIEQLSNDKASIRLGGVYTLIGLADEWLSEDSLYEDERRKEGQIIINNLCAYIRSPFDLASKHKEHTQDQAPKDYEGGTEQLNQDQGRFREEQDIRLAIMQELRDRLRNRLHSLENDSGPWSNFDYNFANTTFFYDIDLSEARFLGKIDLSEARFLGKASFTNAKFNDNSNFKNTFFKEKVDFTEAEFTAYTNFTNTIFNSATNFLNTRFINVADFNKSRFRNRASFSQAFFGGYAHFTNSVFGDEKVDGNTYFNGAQFGRGVSFNNSILTGKTYFDKALFNEINLQSTKIIGSIEFTESYISIEVDGNTAPTLAGFKKGSKNVFSIDPTSSAKLIETEDHRSPDGTITIIPMGCFVFDPNTLEIIPHTPVSNDCTENNYPIKEHSKDD